jgi:hypothetical protein
MSFSNIMIHIPLAIVIISAFIAELWHFWQRKRVNRAEKIAKRNFLAYQAQKKKDND